MYNGDIYTYWEKPFEHSRMYSIHPLDEKGTDKYYSKESHATHYLKRIDPFVYKSILDINNDLLKLPKNERIDYGSPINNRIIKDENQKNNELDNAGILEKNLTNRKEKINNNKKEHTILQKKKLLKNLSCGNLLDIKGRENYLSKFRPYIIEKNFKDTFGYDKNSQIKSVADTYRIEINALKSENTPKVLKVRPNKRYDGYTIYNTPVIKRTLPSSSSFVYNIDKMKKTLDCINQPNKKSMNEKELRDNLLNQTSVKFRKMHHLPDILNIAKKKSLISKQLVGYSKFLGEKYNPTTFIVPPKNRTYRNYVGDLFTH